MKKLFKILGIIILLVILVLASLVVYLKITYNTEKIKGIVSPIISEAIGRDVDIKNANISIFPSIGFSLDGISISNTARTIEVKKDILLSTYFSKFNLNPAYSVVEINGKEITNFVENNVKLSKGDKLKIWRKGFSNKENLFSMKNITISVKFLPLLQKKVEISKILFDEISILAEVDKRGSFNFDDIIPPSSDDSTKKTVKAKDIKSFSLNSLPIELNLESFEIRNAKIIYRNLQKKQEITLGDINQNVFFSIDKNLENIVTKGLLEVKNISVSGEGFPVRKSNMQLMFKHDLAVNLKTGSLTINDIQAGFQKNIITIKGKVLGFDKNLTDIDVSINTNKILLKELFAEIPSALNPEIKKISTGGSAELSVNIKGVMDKTNPNIKPKIVGNLKLKDIFFKYADLPKSLNGLNSDINFTNNSLNIPKLAFKIGKNPILIRAIVDNFKSPTVNVAVNADLDLSIVKDVVPLEKGVSVSGHIKTNLKANGKVDPNDPTKIAVNGGVDFDKIVVTTPQVKKPIKMNGNFLFSNKELNLNNFTTVIGASSITMDMNISDYLGLILPERANSPTKITYIMNSPNFDLNEILGLDIEKMKKENNKKSFSTVKTATATNSSTGDEPIIIPEIPNVIFYGKIRFDKINMLTMPVKNTSVDLNYANRKVNLKMGATLFTGIITEIMHLDFTSKTIKINNIFNSEKMQGNDFISAFNDVLEEDGSINSQIKNLDNTIYGKMGLKTNISSNGYTSNQIKKNLIGDISLLLSKGEIKSENIFGGLKKGVPKLLEKYVPDLKNIKAEKFETILSIKNENIVVDKLKTETKRGDFSMTGTVSFQGVLNLNTDVRFDKKVSDKILSNQNKVKNKVTNTANKLIKNDILKKAVNQGLSQVEVVPSDKDGRVTAIINISGPSDKLKYTFKGFKGDATAKATEDKSIKDNLKDRAKAELEKQKAKLKADAEKAKKEALARLNVQKAKKEALARKKIVEQKAKIEAEKRKAKAKIDAEKARAKAKAGAKKREVEKKAKAKADKLKKGLGF